MCRILIKQAPDLTADLRLMRPIAVTALHASIITITRERNGTNSLGVYTKPGITE
jgi:hypothetical protein